jgi:hypothetical protein
VNLEAEARGRLPGKGQVIADDVLHAEAHTADNADGHGIGADTLLGADEAFHGS